MKKCNHEEQLYNQIIDIVEDNMRFNNSVKNLLKAPDDHILYRKIYKPEDYLDGRRWLMEMPNFCQNCWEKINYKKIKKQLSLYLM